MSATHSDGQGASPQPSRARRNHKRADRRIDGLAPVRKPVEKVYGAKAEYSETAYERRRRLRRESESA